MLLNKKIKFSSSRHLNARELEKYCSGNLDPEERHRYEMHLVDCAFCSEAVEGIAEMDEPFRILKITRELHSRALHKKSAGHKLFTAQEKLIYISIALVLAILILLSLFILSVQK